MSELYPVLLPFAACIIFFIVWISQQKKSVRKHAVAKAVSLAAQREDAAASERTVEPAAMQTSAA